MKEFDMKGLEGCDEEDLLLRFVICEDHELLYLDTYLRETFSRVGLE